MRRHPIFGVQLQATLERRARQNPVAASRACRPRTIGSRPPYYEDVIVVRVPTRYRASGSRRSSRTVSGRNVEVIRAFERRCAQRHDSPKILLQRLPRATAGTSSSDSTTRQELKLGRDVRGDQHGTLMHAYGKRFRHRSNRPWYVMPADHNGSPAFVAEHHKDIEHGAQRRRFRDGSRMSASGAAGRVRGGRRPAGELYSAPLQNRPGLGLARGRATVRPTMSYAASPDS